MLSPDIADYFGFGRSKMPAHRSDVTTCPCMNCRKTRGVGSMLKEQSKLVRLILWLKYMRWKFTKERNKRMGKR